MNVLAISGSLRARSINSALCRAAARLAPPPMTLQVYAALGTLPLFNPDLEVEPPVAVRAFWTQVGDADALLIASPEYAHGISAPMKNALDWLVSFEGTVHKPIAVINASPRAHHANEALQEVLRTMSTDVVAEASTSIPLLGVCTTESAMLESPEVSRAIRASLEALASHLAGAKHRNPSFPLG